LTSLPPELVGKIYEHLWPYDRFLPIASALLYFQRSNLYNEVDLHRRRLLLKFCDTIIEAGSNIGAMVKSLTFYQGTVRESENENVLVQIRGGLPYKPRLIDPPLRSMLPHLVNLERLRIHATFIARSAFTSYDEAPAPSSLTSLELKLDDYTLVDRILLLFPSLQHLDIAIRVEGFDEPTTDRIPLDPPRRLETIRIYADYRSQAICNVIASIESIRTTLEGRHAQRGLASLRNSEVMKELNVRSSYAALQAENLDRSLLKLTNLEKLSLEGGRACVSDRFFTDYFNSELPLESLHLTAGLTHNLSDLIHAFEIKPMTLKSVVLDWAEGSYYVVPRDWRKDMWRAKGFNKVGVEELIEIYTKGGVEISGSAVEILSIINGDHPDSEEEEEEEEDEESEEDEELSE
jgi:hypothetical protein